MFEDMRGAALRPSGSLKELATGPPLGVVGAPSLHRAPVSTSYDECLRARYRQSRGEESQDSTRTAFGGVR